MPTIDPAAINTVILTALGIGGSVFIMRYIRPILDTQEKHRLNLTSQVATLTEKAKAAENERSMLREMVTQRAQVDDLSQRVKMSSDDSAVHHRTLLAEVTRHDREGGEAHQKQLLVMNEMVATLREVSDRLHRGGGQRGPAGPSGERGEKGDHGQDAN